MAFNVATYYPTCGRLLIIEHFFSPFIFARNGRRINRFVHFHHLAKSIKEAMKKKPLKNIFSSPTPFLCRFFIWFVDSSSSSGRRNERIFRFYFYKCFAFFSHLTGGPTSCVCAIVKSLKFVTYFLSLLVLP